MPEFEAIVCLDEDTEEDARLRLFSGEFEDPEIREGFSRRHSGYVGWDENGSPVFAVIDLDPPSIEPRELLEMNPEVVNVSEEEFRSRRV